MDQTTALNVMRLTKVLVTIATFLVSTKHCLEIFVVTVK